MRRRSPKLLCEVLKSKNVVCTPNNNVIDSYLPFSFFSFFYDNVIAIRCKLLFKLFYRISFIQTCPVPYWIPGGIFLHLCVMS